MGLVLRDAGRASPSEADRAGELVGAVEEAAQEPQHRVLAAIGLAQQNHGLARAKREREGVELARLAMRDAEILDLEDRARLAHGRSPSSSPAASRASRMNAISASAGNAAVHHAWK